MPAPRPAAWLPGAGLACLLLYASVHATTPKPRGDVTAATPVASSALAYPRPRLRPAGLARAPALRFPRPRRRPALASAASGRAAPAEPATRTYRAPSPRAGADQGALVGVQRSLGELCSGASRVPVEALHLGDSHTAGDVFTGYLRDRFQAEFGAGGRGMLPAGVPFKYYRPTQLDVSSASRWQHHNSVKRKHSGPFGVSGFRAVGEQAGQRVVLKSSAREPVGMFKLEVHTLARGGALNVKIGDAPVARVSTRDGARPRKSGETLLHWAEPLRTRDGQRLPFVEHTFYVPDGARRIELWPAGDGPVELLSWSLRRGEPGVLYHSHGVVGATAEIVRRWDRPLVHAELDRMRPDLILFAYGTNEGFNDGLDVRRYTGAVRRALADVRAAAPYASIAIVAPPDAARVPRFCAKAVRQTAGCRALEPLERRNYSTMMRNKDRRLCRWHAPPNLDRVRDALARVAADDGYFYWDWSAVMGGACGVDRWTRQTPRLAHGDRVHLTNRGYRRSADALYEALRGPVRCTPHQS